MKRVRETSPVSDSFGKEKIEKVDNEIDIIIAKSDQLVNREVKVDYAKQMGTRSSAEFDGHTYASATQYLQDSEAEIMVLEKISSSEDFAHATKLLSLDLPFREMRVNMEIKSPTISAECTEFFDWILKENKAYSPAGNILDFTYTAGETEEAFALCSVVRTVKCSVIHKNRYGPLFPELIRLLKLIANSNRIVVIRAGVTNLKRVFENMAWERTDSIEELLRMSEIDKKNKILSHLKYPDNEKTYQYHLKETIAHDNNEYYFFASGAPIRLEKLECDSTQRLQQLLNNYKKDDTFILFTARQNGQRHSPVCAEAEVAVNRVFESFNVATQNLLLITCYVEDDFTSWFCSKCVKVKTIPTIIKHMKPLKPILTGLHLCNEETVNDFVFN